MNHDVCIFAKNFRETGRENDERPVYQWRFLCYMSSKKCLKNITVSIIVSVIVLDYTSSPVKIATKDHEKKR